MIHRSPPDTARTHPRASRTHLSAAAVVTVLLTVVMALGWPHPPGPRGTIGSPSEEAPTNRASPQSSPPLSGDAAGADVPALPRFPGSRRAWYREANSGNLVIIDVGYDAVASIDAVLAHYRDVFRSGWVYGDIIVTSDRTRYFVIRNDREAIVDVTADGGIVTVAVVHSRPSPTATASGPGTSPAPSPSAWPDRAPPPQPQPTPRQTPQPSALPKPDPTRTPSPRPLPTRTPRPPTPAPRPTCPPEDDDGCDDGDDGDDGDGPGGD